MFFLKDLPTRRMIERYREAFPDMDVSAVESALHMLRLASLLMRELEAHFSSRGLSQLRFLVLIVLDREPNETRLMVSEIADRLDVSRPVTTRTIQALEREGLVTVNGHDADDRAKVVMLTDYGRETLHSTLPGYYAIIETFMKPRDETRRLTSGDTP